jgi:hypothetical protein
MTKDLFTEWLAELSGIGAGLAPIIFGVAVSASFVVLAIFRRRVRRSLEREQPRPETPHSQTLAAADAEPTRHERSIAVQPDPVPSESRWSALAIDATGHRKRLARLYMIGGVGLAVAFAAIGTMTALDHSHAPLSRFLYSAICFSSPLILVARSVYGCWAPWLVRVAIVAALLAVVTQALPFANEEAGAALLMAALLALLLHPRVRAMGPFALGFFSIVFVGAAIASVSAVFVWVAELRADLQTAATFASIQAMEPVRRAETIVSFAKEFLPRLLWIAAVGAAAGLLVSVLLGGLLLRLVTTSYSQKRTSDQWLVIASVWSFFSLAIAFSLPALAANLACAAAFVFVVRFMWSRLPRPESPCLRLLLLRSFSLGERSTRLFQEFETLWRGVGSIQLVGAADLAGSTLEPHELLDFFRGRSGRYFAHSESDVDRRLASFDYATDPDGRFRVNEIFCIGDATWQHAVRRLLAESHCVLIDVRGFTRYRAGCVFEIQCLAKSAPGSRIVFLVDGVTDRAFIGEIWANAANASPVAARGETSAFEFVSDKPEPERVCERILAAFSSRHAAMPVHT